MRQFVDGRIPVAEFQESFLTSFSNELEFLDDELFDLLDGIFADVDSYTTDESLLSLKPHYYINEKVLRERVSEALKLYSFLQP